MFKRFLPVLFISMALLGCSHPLVKVNDDNDGQIIAIRIKQTIVLSLKSNPTTGYVWEIESLNKDILKQKEDVKFKQESNLIGAPGVQVFKLIGVEPGETDLKLLYHRPWETNGKPAKVFTLQVTVR